MSLTQSSDFVSIDFIGYSMYPALKPSDRLIVKPTKELTKGDIVVFDCGKKSITHRYIGRNGEAYLFLGDRLIRPETVNGEDILGKVVMIIRNGKTLQPQKRSRFSFFYRVGLGAYFRMKNFILQSNGKF